MFLNWEFKLGKLVFTYFAAFFYCSTKELLKQVSKLGQVWPRNVWLAEQFSWYNICFKRSSPKCNQPYLIVIHIIKTQINVDDSPGITVKHAVAKLWYEVFQMNRSNVILLSSLFIHVFFCFLSRTCNYGGSYFPTEQTLSCIDSVSFPNNVFHFNRAKPPTRRIRGADFTGHWTFENPTMVDEAKLFGEFRKKTEISKIFENFLLKTNLSKLGEILFLEASEPAVEDIGKRYQILVWKYGPTIENRHLKQFSGKRLVCACM